MDMVQNSEAPIDFSAHLTRPASASANGSPNKPPTKSSQRYENGDSIDVPETLAELENKDSEDGNQKAAVSAPSSSFPKPLTTRKPLPSLASSGRQNIPDPPINGRRNLVCFLNNLPCYYAYCDHRSGNGI